MREARRSRKLSQEQLALRGGLDRTYASMMERGLRQPTVAVLLRLSEVLDIAATTLLHRTIEELSRQRAKVSRPH